MQDWTPGELQSKLDSGSLVFLKLWKRGCGPCTLSKPALEKIEAKDKHGINFGQICTDDYPEMLEVSNSEVLPFFFLFKDQKMKGKFPGFKGMSKIEEFIETSLS